MLPVVALIGRPNVGKSTLFNFLTHSRDALVDNQPGITRDRLYGRCKVGKVPFLLVDTGGLENNDSDFAVYIRQQVDLVITESDIVLFMVDALQGVVPADLNIAQMLRYSGVKIQVVVNKSEGLNPDVAASEFGEFGLGRPALLSATRGSGVKRMLDMLFPAASITADEPENSETPVPAIAIVGRPNVGKSTLLNRLAGQNRVIVSDIPGTTRDSIRIPIQVNDQAYEVIDTAGIRKKSSVNQKIEKFSVVKTLQAIEASQAVLLILDAGSGVETQDLAIAGMIHDLGRSIVIVINKWDVLKSAQKRAVSKKVRDRLSFLPDYEQINISAKYGSNIRNIFPAAARAEKSAMISISTSSLNRFLADATYQKPPPVHNRRPIRLKFAHQASRNPPVIIIHGGQVNKLPQAYQRYLAKFFANAYKLTGTPVRIVTRENENPFKNKASKNQPVRRQPRR